MLPFKRPLRPMHERIVMLHFMGKTNSEIGELTGYTKEHVSNIICDPQSVKIIEELKTRLRANILGEVEEDLLVAAGLGAKRIRETMEVEVPNRMASVAFVKHQDTLGAKLLESLGYLGKEEEEEGKARGIQIATEHGARLAKALELSDQVRGAEEADYEIVSDDRVERDGTDG